MSHRRGGKPRNVNTFARKGTTLFTDELDRIAAERGEPLPRRIKPAREVMRERDLYLYEKYSKEYETWLK